MQRIEGEKFQSAAETKVNLSSEPNFPLKIFVAIPSLLTPPMACSTFIRILEIKALSSFPSGVKSHFLAFFGTKV